MSKLKFISFPIIPLALMIGKREKESCDHFMIDITFTLFGKRYDFTLEQE